MQSKSEHECYWCQSAEARRGALGKPACGECADAIAAFYRGEAWRLKAIVDAAEAR